MCPTIYEQFKTRTMRGRKLAKPGWISAMVPTGAAPVVRPSAYIRPVTLRRRATRRRLLELPEFLSKYIAPTTAAIEMDQKPFKVKYERKIRLTPPLALYPPPTGPPNFIFTARPKRVSQHRRLIPAAKQIVYPATLVQPQQVDPPDTIKRRSTRFRARAIPPVPVYPYVATVSQGSSLSEPFRTKVSKSRKSIAQGWFSALTGAVSASPVTFVDQPERIKRRDTKRKIRALPVTLVYPATPAVSVPFGAVTTLRAKGRKSRGLGFVSVDAIVGQPAAVTTAASYPSHEEVGYRKRRETKRKLRTVAPSPVFPYVAPSTSPDTSLAEPFRTRISKGRKNQTLAFIPVFPATPPVNTTYVEQARSIKRRVTERTLRTATVAPVFPATPAAPVVYGAIVRPKQHRRKSVSPGFVLDYALVGAPQVPGYDATESYGYLRRRETAHKLRTVAVAPVFPATPATPAQPPEAVRQAIARYVRSQVRKVQWVYTPQNVDAAPYVPPVEVIGGGGGGGGGRIVYPARYGKHPSMEIEEMWQKVVAEVMYKDISTAIVPQATKAAAKAIVQPTRKPVDWDAIQRDVEKVKALYAIWAEIQRRKQQDLDDEEWFILGD